MLLDVIFDSLRFLDRDDFDVCQLATKSICKFVERTPTLALRTIIAVAVGNTNGRPYVSIWNGRVELELWQDAVQAGDVHSLAHLRNAYIERIGLLSGAERCVSLLCGASDALKFKVGLLIYMDNLQETETLHQSVDWIVRDLRVADYVFQLSDRGGSSNNQALLPTTLSHDSVRATAEYCSVAVGL